MNSHSCEHVARRIAAGIPDRRAATSEPPWKVQGLQGGARAYCLWRTLVARPRPTLAIVPDAARAEALVDDLRFFFGEDDSAAPFARRIHYFPAWDVGPFDDLSPTPDIVAARIEGLYHLQQTRDPIVVTTPDALLQRVPPQDCFAGRLRYLVEGDTLDLEATGAQLVDWGYRRVPLVEDRGDFGIRGGILDIFPPAHVQPLRIELDGDLIATIRDFDPISQRSLQNHPELLILPVREFDAAGRTSRQAYRAVEERLFDLDVKREERAEILDGLETGLLFPGIEFFLPYFYPTLDLLDDYVPPDALVWIEGAGAVDAAIERVWLEIERRAEERTAAQRYLPPIERLYASPQIWRAAVASRPTVETETLEVLGGIDSERTVPVRSYLMRDLKIDRIAGRREVSFGPVAERVRAWRADGHRVLVVAGAAPQAERLRKLFGNHDLEIDTAPSLAAALSSPAPRIVVGHLHDGFRLPDDGLAIATEADIFGEAKQRRRTRRVEVAQLLKNLSELKPDDFVVHIDHGVGCYKGLKHLQVAGTAGDYLHLEYAGGDRLYVPVDRISLVQKYVGADGAAPALDKLGGTAWERVKHKTRESILAMARELLAVHAAREVMERKGFGSPDAYFRAFEAAFPFEETPDQQQAIDDVLADLQRDKPMDRLICGDVGYGKTEVAMRAAFLAAIEGGQVAVLVPTTVLAQQHYNTLRKRFEGYPVRVEMLSRFLARTQTQAVVRGLATGEVDFVVGTHRLLQSDIKFKRLRLLVIDEEHRFGVRHKERIKQMRQLVDVLTLTATPIPRTLQMSLLGLRDLSVIETPPIDRLAIRTYVTRYDEGLVREAIVRELGRGGQVFYVHNRVETIEMRARRLRELVPEASFAVAHGQMAEGALERVMSDFFAKHTNVLVCSAIIESGLDVPNANTIIIDRADHFGLAQLYQLRGRVGRSHERAYAYLMIPGEHLISRDAQLRLRALQELDDLGGGFKLAAHDLEIRGAGNLLGKQQSGHVTAVGFELYQQMMEEAVRELRGEHVTVEVEPEIQLGIAAFIPGTYIPDENQRLVVYRRLTAIKGRSDLEAVAEELRDRYGPIPPHVDSLLRVMDLRRTLKDCLVLRATLRDGTVTLQFHPDAPVDRAELVRLVTKSKGRLALRGDAQLLLRPASADWDGLVAEIQELLYRLNAPIPEARLKEVHGQC
ncbi:transcription-repair coupling factor [Candidatus Binatia bacterium]|nr:transcription-repair coupling factor [Candidatus Binatia bacterium]